MALGAGVQIAGIDVVEAAAAHRQLRRRRDGLDLAGAKAFADIADKRRAETFDQLRELFINKQ